MRLHALARRAAAPAVEGRLSEVVGLVLEARGCRAAIGDLWELRPEDGPAVEAEVVGLRGERTLLMPLGLTAGLEVGTPLRRLGRAARARVGRGLLGRVVDALGRPLDGGPPPVLEHERSLDGGAPRNPLQRRPVEEPFLVGVRAIDGMLTLGVGQRIGIFAGGGVGKSSLLGMMIRRAQADVAVVALIGERGREVEEFVHRTLGDEGMARSVVVAATSAETPLLRARGALYATTIAEHFRDQGLRVLLVMDSVTRYAMALREIGLAVGEPPTTKGYTPTVFAQLPRLLERAGTADGAGAITGVYTVLVEGDDLSDPIADAARAILDGHVVLSRELAERGHFPAIDAAASVSRCMPQVVDAERIRTAQRARELLAHHREVQDLRAIGAYTPGTSPALDEAVARWPALETFLRQRLDELVDVAATPARLAAVWGKP
ncbi:MAG: FliI/YscN family ATPase [Sandaracinus sp.]|nr:FliI/YscN family ATPase [Sandaracinus sp.]